MAGLLDVLNSDDGRMALGLLSAAGPSAVPMSFGQRLGGAMQQQDAYLAQKKAQQAAEQERLLKAQFIQAQMSDMMAQQQQREAQARQLQQQAQEHASYLRDLSPQQVGASEAMAGAGGPTPKAAQMMGQVRGPDLAALALKYPDKAKQLQELAGRANWGREEVSNVEGVMPGTNNPATLFRNKFGDLAGSPVPKAVEMKLMNLGGTEQAYNPFALGQDQAFKRTNSPGELLSANTTMRGQNMTDARMRDSNAIAAGGRVTEGEDKLRKEFEGLPEVKNYKQAYPSYAGIVDAAKRSSPMSDINIVYGLAKLYDPTSVVREGEYATVANAPNVPERVKGWANYLQGGGKLTEQTKKQILAEAEGRINSYAGEALKARDSYKDIASRNGLNPQNVFAGMGGIGKNGEIQKPATQKQVVRTGTDAQGRRVVQYNDGSIEHAN